MPTKITIDGKKSYYQIVEKFKRKVVENFRGNFENFNFEAIIDHIDEV